MFKNIYTLPMHINFIAATLSEESESVFVW